MAPSAEQEHMKRHIVDLFWIAVCIVVATNRAAAQTPTETPSWTPSLTFAETSSPTPTPKPKLKLPPPASFSLTQTQPAPTAAPSSIPSDALEKAVGWGIAVGMALQGGDAMQTAFCLG